MVLALASVKVMVVSLIAVVIGLVMQPALKYCDKKRWLKFTMSTTLPDLHTDVHENTQSLVP